MLYSNIYNYNSAIFYFLRPFFIKNKDGKNSDKGWKPLEGQLSPTIKVISQQDGNIEPVGTLNPEKILLFNKMIALTKGKNCKLLFVFSPDFSPLLSETCTMKYIKKLSINKNIAVLDFSADQKITGHPYFYKDIYHLNKSGANEFTEFLVKRISESELLQNNQQNRLSFINNNY